MSAERVFFAGLSVILPDDWVDVTDELPLGSPFSLAPQFTGVGVLQFSVAAYRRGDLPQFDLSKLTSMLNDFFGNKGFGRPKHCEVWGGVTFGVYGDCCLDAECYRIWYISDGKNVALITYTALREVDVLVEKELMEADSIVRSVLFEAE